MLQKVENYRHALDQLEKSIISYSFIEFLSQTQKAAKPFCNDLAAFICLSVTKKIPCSSTLLASEFLIHQ